MAVINGTPGPKRDAPGEGGSGAATGGGAAGAGALKGGDAAQTGFFPRRAGVTLAPMTTGSFLACTHPMRDALLIIAFRVITTPNCWLTTEATRPYVSPARTRGSAAANTSSDQTLMMKLQGKR
nr:hypothetical protein [Azorhizobium doebereinerae]